jgi:prenyltransferase beta subunit
VNPTRRRFVTAAAALGTATVVGARQLTQSPTPVADLITPETQSAIDRGLAYLSRAQLDDGGYPDGQFGTGNVAVTALAGLSLMAGGHQPGRGLYARTVSRAVDYVLRRQSPIGLLSSTEAAVSHAAMYQHGFGTLFLAEVYGMLPDAARNRQVRDALDRAVQLILGSQQKSDSAGWRYDIRPNDADVSVTVAMMMALRAAKNAGLAVPKSVIDAAVKYVKQCQTQDGGFVYKKEQQFAGSAFARSAAAVVGLYSAGIYDGREIDNGLQYLIRFSPNRRGGWGNDIRPEYYFYGQYYAALAMWTAGGAYWAEWFPAIRDELLAKGRAGGQGIWQDFHGPAFATAIAGIVLQLPNNYLPILQK